ncbi:CLUMA_CG006754, isoform A [Clunio marinus]|uniref:CLUMA_CG006754, isoform A n=1 Tax=Clunio marinus TaxID=568069 RepID=A0A1J1I097_9DIPT|nr:CLUMA_CG006754, isoform A [Clunio marinus]
MRSVYADAIAEREAKNSIRKDFPVIANVTASKFSISFYLSNMKKPQWKFCTFQCGNPPLRFTIQQFYSTDKMRQVSSGIFTYYELKLVENCLYKRQELLLSI